MRLGLGLGLTFVGGTGGGGGPTAYVQPIVMAGASNTAGGDDSACAALSSADDDSRLRWLHPGTGAIIPLDYTSGIPRPGGSSMVSTTPAINFTKYLADLNDNGEALDIVYVLVPTAVGGRGVYGGGSSAGLGPWDPDGTGDAWDIGGSRCR